MQFSDTSNLTGLVEDIDFLCDSNATSYALKDKARNVNRWAYRVVTWLLDSSPAWTFDDSNLASQPIVTTTLVAGQQDYELPTNVLRVDRASVLNASGDYYDLDMLPFDNIPEDPDEFMATDGLPKFLVVRGSSVHLFPAPASGQVTTAAGLKLYIAREIDLFASDDTAQEAGFVELYHRILSLGASYDFMLKYDANRATSYLGQIEMMKKELYEHEQGKIRAIKPHISLAHSTEDYL